MTKKAERRKYVRIPVKIRMLLRDEEGKGELYFVSKNLSAGGVFLVSDLLLEPQSRVYIEFTLPNDPKLIVAKGEIMWAREEVSEDIPEAGMGIKFLNLDEESRGIIIEFIKKNLSAK